MTLFAVGLSHKRRSEGVFVRIFWRNYFPGLTRLISSRGGDTKPSDTSEDIWYQIGKSKLYNVGYKNGQFDVKRIEGLLDNRLNMLF